MGNLRGLKPSQIKALEKLYNRRFPDGRVFSQDQAREIALLSRAVNRQIALMIDRRGKVAMVIAGDASGVSIPELPPVAARRLRGWRMIHTHLGPSLLDREDLLDLLFLRLDAIAALSTNETGEPEKWQEAVLTDDAGDEPWSVSSPRAWHDGENELSTRIAALDARVLSQTLESGEGRAFLISVSSEPYSVQERNLKELASLARASGLEPVGELAQRVRVPNPNFILGKGKLAELEIKALYANADILIFDGELTPAQLNNLAETTRRKVLDRTQVILDIFAQRAASREGKLQVELAQLAYNQPRLTGKNRALDRLAGGVGGRGPGESKLESDRRKIRERIGYLKRELEKSRKQRAFLRAGRDKRDFPHCALVGYTNAGKSTLLNILTASTIYAADQPFATLDPVARRLKFPRDKSVIITDTVGFIRNLPKELMTSFRATLEELDQADILLHVADAASEDVFSQVESAENILEELGLTRKKTILVLNKSDLLSPEKREALSESYPRAVFVSALNGDSLRGLLTRLDNELFLQKLNDQNEENYSGDPQ